MTALGFTVSDTGVATLTLDNPPQNRLTMDLMGSLHAAIQRISTDPAIRVALVRSEGPDFSFGGDITNWLDITPQQMAGNITGALQLFNAFEQMPVPVVAMVQGRCMGGGFELALRADVIIATESAEFCHTEQSLAVITFLGGVQRVAERAGKTRAMSWALTSERVPAKEMFEAGVITEVVADSDLEGAASAWVARLAQGATQAHAGHKQMLHAWSHGGVEAADKLIPAITEAVMNTQDAQRGIASAQDALRRGVERPVLVFEGK